MAAPARVVTPPDEAPAGNTAQTNQPPVIYRLWGSLDEIDFPAQAPGDSDDDTFESSATVGQAWQAGVDAVDGEDQVLHWKLLEAPAGMTLAVADGIATDKDGKYHSLATLRWIPGRHAMAATDVVLGVIDGHGAVSVRTFHLAVGNGQHAPVLASIDAIELKEGEAWSLPLTPGDADGDVLTTQVDHLPPGARFDAANGVLSWTPGYDQAGRWPDVTVRVSDGLSTVHQPFEFVVAQAQPMPVLAAVAPQTLQVGKTFVRRLHGRLPKDLTLAEGATVKLGYYFCNVPPGGMMLGSDTGLLAFTPNADQTGHADVCIQLIAKYTLPDGEAVSRIAKQTIAFDTLAADAASHAVATGAAHDAASPVADVHGAKPDQAPVLRVGNHVAVFGQPFNLPIHRGGEARDGLTASDPDDAVKAQKLTLGFQGLPGYARYDGNPKRLTLSLGFVRSGDHVLGVQASDGQATAQTSFTVRVGSDADAIAPKVTIDGLPDGKVVLGPPLTGVVHATSFARIAGIKVQARGSALGLDRWRDLPLDNDGRFRVQAVREGVIDVRVTATDIDGHSHAERRQVDVQDPAGSNGLALTWAGALKGATADGRAVRITVPTVLRIASDQVTTMGYRLQIAPLGSEHWQLLDEKPSLAGTAHPIDLARIDPPDFANGAYRLRLLAWDSHAHVSELQARVVIASSNKHPPHAVAADITYRLGGHDVALARTQGTIDSYVEDFGDWRLAGFDTRFNTDQSADLVDGNEPPWQLGVQVWLSIPTDLAHPAASRTRLHFTLGTQPMSSASRSRPSALVRADFGSDRGWTLEASNGDSLQRQGKHLHDVILDGPWMPLGYVLGAPDGIRYMLDAHGQVTQVRFADGVQWLVSDSGIALIGSDTARIQWLRDGRGRIVRATGPTEGGTRTVFYRYGHDDHLRLARARVPGTRYGDDRGNRAPLAVTTLPHVRTHTDLAVRIPLAPLARDPDGDDVFWRVLGASHGSATMSRDGENAIFHPQPGFSGTASLRVVADDGTATSAPITLGVDVSGARLTAIHLAPLDNLKPGLSVAVGTRVDFTDQAAVAVADDPGFLHLALANLKAMGVRGPSVAHVDDVRDRLQITAAGPALLLASRTESDGRVIQAAQSLNVHPAPECSDSRQGGDCNERPVRVTQPDVYPATLSLAAGATRGLDMHIIEPNEGKVVAIAPGATTVRYVSSAPGIASVDASGRITAHRAGTATISALYLYTVSWVDYGDVPEQTLGQQDIALRVADAVLSDDDSATAAPAKVLIAAAKGGIVRDASGDTVMIGAGALASDAQVAIRRLDVAQYFASGATPVPGSGVLEVLGGFHLDLGDKPTRHLLQVSVPMQTGGAKPGDPVVLLRKAPVMVPGGKTAPSWWLVDNGRVGEDGIIHAGGRDFGGLDCSGDYVVARALPGAASRHVMMSIPRGDWVSFDGLHVTLAAGLADRVFEDAMTGTLTASSSGLSVGAWHYGVVQFGHITVPKAVPGKAARVGAGNALPPTPYPFGKITLPKLGDPYYDDASGKLVFAVSGLDSGEYRGSVVLRMRLENSNKTRDVATVHGNTDRTTLRIDPPRDVALQRAGWQLVRQLSTATVMPSGRRSTSAPLEFNGDSARLPYASRSALCQLGIADATCMDQTADRPDLLTTVLEWLLSGRLDLHVANLDVFTHPPVYTCPDHRCYTADKSRIRIFYKAAGFRPGPSIAVPGGGDITALANAGRLLFIGTGAASRNGRITGSSQLLMQDIGGYRSSGPDGPMVAIKGTGIEASAFGIASMAEGSGNILVLAVPGRDSHSPKGAAGQDDELRILDLDSLDLSTGTIAAPAVVDLGTVAEHRSSFTIASSTWMDQFRVTRADGHGAIRHSTLKLIRDASRHITGGVLKPGDPRPM